MVIRSKVIERRLEVGALAALAFVTVAGCAGARIPPPQLVDARNEYGRAKGGPAMQLDPTDVHEADLALQRAEQAWADQPDEPTTVDLAVIAQRKAQIAEQEAAALKAQQDMEQAKRDLQATTSSQLQSARGQLNQAQTELQRKQAEAAAQQQKLDRNGS